MVDKFSIDSLQQFSDQIDEMRDAKKSNQLDDQSFQNMLNDLIDQVDQAQKQADQSIEGLATGETNGIHDVVMKMEEADVAFKLMKQIRDKLIDAYKELMAMK